MAAENYAHEPETKNPDGAEKDRLIAAAAAGGHLAVGEAARQPVAVPSDTRDNEIADYINMVVSGQRPRTPTS
jgi:hypothetical protein